MKDVHVIFELEKGVIKKNGKKVGGCCFFRLTNSQKVYRYVSVGNVDAWLKQRIILNMFRNTVSTDFSVNSYRKVSKREPPTSRLAGALRFSEIMGVQGTCSQQQVAQTNLHS